MKTSEKIAFVGNVKIESNDIYFKDSENDLRKVDVISSGSNPAEKIWSGIISSSLEENNIFSADDLMYVLLYGNTSGEYSIESDIYFNNINLWNFYKERYFKNNLPVQFSLKNVVIKGNGHTIYGLYSEKNSIFKDLEGVILENIHFINCKSEMFAENIISSTFNNVHFERNEFGKLTSEISDSKIRNSIFRDNGFAKLFESGSKVLLENVFDNSENETESTTNLETIITCRNYVRDDSAVLADLNKNSGLYRLNYWSTKDGKLVQVNDHFPTHESMLDETLKFNKQLVSPISDVVIPSGDGTEESPYIIYNIGEFESLKALNLGGYTELLSDLDYSGVTNFNQFTSKVNIILEGNGHFISNISLDDNSFFGSLENVEIRNLNIDRSKMNTLFTMAENLVVKNIMIFDSLFKVAAIAENATNATIDDSKFIMNLKSELENAGLIYSVGNLTVNHICIHGTIEGVESCGIASVANKFIGDDIHMKVVLKSSDAYVISKEIVGNDSSISDIFIDYKHSGDSRVSLLSYTDTSTFTISNIEVNADIENASSILLGTGRNFSIDKLDGEFNVKTKTFTFSGIEGDGNIDDSRVVLISNDSTISGAGYLSGASKGRILESSFDAFNYNNIDNFYAFSNSNKTTIKACYSKTCSNLTPGGTIKNSYSKSIVYSASDSDSASNLADGFLEYLLTGYDSTLTKIFTSCGKTEFERLPILTDKIDTAKLLNLGGNS